MDINLKSKKALVCGASKGIGQAIATELASLGAEVTLMARNEVQLNEVVKTLPQEAGQKHNVIVADFKDPDAVKNQIEKTGKSFHILVNNTGGPKGGKVYDATIEDFEQAFRMHLHSGHLLVNYVVPFMKEENYGRIINVVSTSVRIPIPGLGVSNTVRGAMASWAKTLANELAGDGITVNNILPGFTETDRLYEIVRNNAQKKGLSEEEVIHQMKSSTPAGRFGQPHEIGALAGFLASPSAGYITGTSIAVDGGRTGSI